MKKFKHLLLVFLGVASLAMSGCLHLVEEVTVNKNGSGNYKMTLDLSEMKGMMDMLKGMSPDSTAEAGASEEALPMGQLQDEMLNVKESIERLPGISNIVESPDTNTFIFSYSFDFKDAASLNSALRVLFKEKYDKKVEDVFTYKKNTFERLPAADLGTAFTAMLNEAGESAEDEGSMDMMKMFFADMTYKQVYHFPDRTVKKSSNKLSEIGTDGHSVSITLKPFDEEQKKENAGVATVVKLK